MTSLPSFNESAHDLCAVRTHNTRTHVQQCEAHVRRAHAVTARRRIELYSSAVTGVVLDLHSILAATQYDAIIAAMSPLADDRARLRSCEVNSAHSCTHALGDRAR